MTDSLHLAELERGVYAALETYSNVHRGSGHNSMVSTHLYEHARNIVLEYLGLNKRKFIVVFCTPGRAAALTARLKPESYRILSSQEMGLALGVRALVVRRNTLPKGAPFQTGGGTTRLIAPGWIIWADAPDMLEAGTPAIINVIAFAKALQLTRKYGKDIFKGPASGMPAVHEIIYQDDVNGLSGRELSAALRQSLVGRGIRVPTLEGARPFINLDNAASTPTFTPVWEAFRTTWNLPEQAGKEVIEEVRAICAGMLGAPLNSYDVFFTSNTTEAINLAAGSLGHEQDQDSEPVVLSSILEHSSNDLPWRMLPGHSLIRLSADAEGFLDLKEMEQLLSAYNDQRMHGSRRIRLVAVSGGSNVLGVCNHLAEISRIVHRYGARLLVDAAQLVAHRRVEMEQCGIDILAFSGHKVYAPFGCGVLAVRKGSLQFNSAEMDLIRSSGEENASGIAALGKALVLLQRIGMDVIREEEDALTAQALRGVAQIPGLRIYGITDPGSASFRHRIGVIAFSMKGKMPNQLAKELALRGGIGVRYGCHCAHLLVKHLLGVGPALEGFQHMLLTLFPKITLPGIARVSLGIENTEEDVDALIRVVGEIAAKTRTSGRGAVKKQMKDFVSEAAKKVYSIPQST